MAQIGNWILDAQTNALHWSDEVYRIFGLPPQSFIATYDAFLDAIHPEDRQMVHAAYIQSLENKTPYEITHRILTSEGSIKFVAERCETFYDDHGHPLRSVGTVQDITDRKRSDEIIEKRATELATVAEISVAASTLLDIDSLLQKTVDLTKERFGLYHAHVYLFDETRDILFLAAGSGEIGRQMAENEHFIHLQAKPSLVAYAARERRGMLEGMAWLADG